MDSAALRSDVLTRNVAVAWWMQCEGGNVGLMGVVARTVSGITGKDSVVGVIPKELSTVEVQLE